VLVRIDDLLDVLVIDASPNLVALLSLDIVDLLFELEAIKMKLIHI
jgi:hypothetical protein